MVSDQKRPLLHDTSSEPLEVESHKIGCKLLRQTYEGAKHLELNIFPGSIRWVFRFGDNIPAHVRCRFLISVGVTAERSLYTLLGVNTLDRLFWL